jgi:hypothetical protein
MTTVSNDINHTLHVCDDTNNNKSWSLGQS